MMTKAINILIVSGFICGITAYNITPVIQDYINPEKVFGVLIAFEFVLLYIAYRLRKGYSLGMSVFLNICVGASLNSLIDELFFDPTLFQRNEYIGFAFTIIFAFFIEQAAIQLRQYRIK